MKESNPDATKPPRYEVRVDLDVYSLEEALLVKKNLIDEWPAPARVRMRPNRELSGSFRVWVRVPLPEKEV